MVVRLADLVLVLGLRVLLVGVGLLLGLMIAGFFGWLCALVDVDLCGEDSAAVYLFDLEGCVEIECGYGFVEDLWVDSGVDEGSEEHVAADAGEAVEVGDTHGVIVSRGWRVWVQRQMQAQVLRLHSGRALRLRGLQM